MGISDLKIAGKDKLERAFVLPKNILWSGDGIKNGDCLLNPQVTQVYVGIPQSAVLSTEEGKQAAILLDFGSEFVGNLELIISHMSSAAGVKLHLRFGESVSEAMTPLAQKNATNQHAVRDMTVQVSQLSQETFAYTGFRFVYIELEDADSWVELAAVRGIFTHRNLPYKGSFQCDDELLNQIYDVCAYTVHVNMQNMLWDGIKRDRLVWIGDIHPEMLAIRTVFGDIDIIEESLRFVSQTNPLPNWPNHITTYSFWYLLILWDWYIYTGKKELVEELQPYWMGLLRQLLSLVHEEQEELLCESEMNMGFFLDWPTHGNAESKAGIYALFRITLLACARMCELVGAEEEAHLCKQNAERFAKKNMFHNQRKQIVAMLQLADMIEKEDAAQLLTTGGGQGMSTFMSYYILSAVANSADITSAQDMLCEYYGAMLDAGATTFWEDFDLNWVREGARIDQMLQPGEYDIHGDNGRFCYIGLRHSLCHGWSAGPAAFLAERVLGIQILEPGCKKVLIKPELGRLNWAMGTYPTPYGEINVKVRREGEELVVEASGPKEIELSF